MTFLPSSSYISWRKELEHRQDPVGLPSVAAFKGFIDESFPTHRPMIEKLVYNFITTL